MNINVNRGEAFLLKPKQAHMLSMFIAGLDGETNMNMIALGERTLLFELIFVL